MAPRLTIDGDERLASTPSTRIHEAAPRPRMHLMPPEIPAQRMTYGHSMSPRKRRHESSLSNGAHLSRGSSTDHLRRSTSYNQAVDSRASSTTAANPSSKQRWTAWLPAQHSHLTERSLTRCGERSPRMVLTASPYHSSSAAAAQAIPSLHPSRRL